MKRNTGAAQHQVYGPMMRQLPKRIDSIKRQIENSRDIREIHRLQEKARGEALDVFTQARDYEQRQTGLFGREGASLPARKEMTDAEVERHARRAGSLRWEGRTKRDAYLRKLARRHGPGEVEKVYHRSMEVSAGKGAKKGKGRFYLMGDMGKLNPQSAVVRPKPRTKSKDLGGPTQVELF